MSNPLTPRFSFQCVDPSSTQSKVWISQSKVPTEHLTARCVHSCKVGTELPQVLYVGVLYSETIN